MTAEVDGASEVREEDAFDVDAVRTWLAARGTELAPDLEVRQFGGGASNLTYSLRDAEHDLVLRRAPTGSKAKGAHDMGREYRIQDGLTDVFPLVPKMVALCEDDAVIGADFYVMHRVDGLIPRRDLPPGVSLDEQQARTLCTNALDVLIDLHRVDVERDPPRVDGQGRGVRRATGLWVD